MAARANVARALFPTNLPATPLRAPPADQAALPNPLELLNTQATLISYFQKSGFKPISGAEADVSKLFMRLVQLLQVSFGILGPDYSQLISNYDESQYAPQAQPFNPSANTILFGVLISVTECASRAGQLVSSANGDGRLAFLRLQAEFSLQPFVGTIDAMDKQIREFEIPSATDPT